MNLKRLSIRDTPSLDHLLNGHLESLHLKFKDSLDVCFVGSTLSYLALAIRFIHIRKFDSSTACQTFALFNVAYSKTENPERHIPAFQLIDFCYYLMCAAHETPQNKGTYHNKGGPAIACALLFQYDLIPGPDKKLFTEKSIATVYKKAVLKANLILSTKATKGTLGFYDSHDSSRGHVIGFQYIQNKFKPNHWLFFDIEFQNNPISPSLGGIEKKIECAFTRGSDKFNKVSWQVPDSKLAPFLWAFSKEIDRRMGCGLNTDQLFVTLLIPAYASVLSNHACFIRRWKGLQAHYRDGTFVEK